VGADDSSPTTVFFSPTYRRYSAFSQLLPMLEQAALFHAINFQRAPLDPDVDTRPDPAVAPGVNDTAAETSLSVFVCPSDLDRLASRWGKLNYRTCNGSTWTGRLGHGMFGQGSHVSPAQVSDGLSNTAAISERVRGSGSPAANDLLSDLFDKPSVWTETAFRDWCAALSPAEVKPLYRDVNGGKTWLEGNMNWTRYNHLLPPGGHSCKNGSTWDGGVVMTATSHHPGAVNLLLGDGSVRFIKVTIAARVWSALGTIQGGESISADEY
jgi:hypothetical protein